MESFQLIALTPVRLDNPAIAIAASRGGGIGILDLGRWVDSAATREAVRTLGRFGKNCGVRLDATDPEILGVLPESVNLVVLSGDPRGLAEAIRRLRAQGRRVVLEVTDLEQARVGVEIGVDGLIAKGQESGGWVGEETAFVLLQRLLTKLPEPLCPIWVRGGIGLHTAAACAAAGAVGVVLDAQLLLTRESSVPEAVRRAMRTMDGSETLTIGSELPSGFRCYARTGGSRAVDELQKLAADLAESGESREHARDRFQAAVEDRIGWGPADLWPLGQDAAFAAPLAKKHRTVSGVLRAFREAIEQHLSAAAALEPLREDGPLARSHGTRYPIVQGPMTRVSDRAEFALSVAKGGGLPFLALALMRAPEVEDLLAQTSRLLGELPWGVGILGFVPLELRREQLEVVSKFRPPLALIAGGRPDQARGLEKEGTKSYLHVPSPGLLELFLKDGARRFVFEGRECGGHVGPRTSFVLWNTMIDKLLESVPPGAEADCHVLFAGGIHDALSASMVAAMAAPLAEKGIRVGVLLGTAYLFTHEAVDSGAIVKGFQEEAIRCERTVTLETGPGHSTRCAETPFANIFQEEKRKLVRSGRSPDEVRDALEMLNIGRLRVASKGIDRARRNGDESVEPVVEKSYVAVPEGEQTARGMYMIGQVAALRETTCTVEELHRDVSVGATERISRLPGTRVEVLPAEREETPSAVAIVGMSSMLPKAPDLSSYWDNILSKVDAVTEIPKERWDWELYFDSDREAKDKIYSKWGGFLDDQSFDPMEFGIPPNSIPSIDPMQLLALKAARQAIEDAGYSERPYDRSRTSVILGASGGTGDLGAGYLLRSSLPLVLGGSAPAVIDRANGLLPEWTEDSFAGLLLNVAAGRIANRFDFGGVNYVVDAACASSLAAVHLAVRELESHATDMVVVGGVDTTQNPFGYLCFSKTRALSPTGRARTFDSGADGIAISEGIVMLVLKRLEDAERDGDRIYAIIRGTAGSSDGRAKGMTAPRPEGQMAALRRAYRKAGFSPATVGLFEAHGTGTVVGDRAEALALSTVLEENGARPQSAAVGSVKSMIGHTKATAGVASIAKTALALYHKVLPPTLGVSEPNPDARLDRGPLYVNAETRPWIQSGATPRRAGTSSFGFGGTNFHAVLEEYTGEVSKVKAASSRWPSELVLLEGRTREEIAARIERILPAVRDGASTLLAVARSAWSENESVRLASESVLRLAIVASSTTDLAAKLEEAKKGLEKGGRIHDARGIYFSGESKRAKVAFLFPGQGSQYPNMLRDLAVHFHEVRERFEAADRILADSYDEPLSRFVFPPPAFREGEARAQQEALTRTDVAQPALGAADVALASLLSKLGVAPDMAAGHSYGEYVALSLAGVFDFEDLCRISRARGRSIIEAGGEDLGTMAAADAGAAAVEAALGTLESVWVSNLNAPRQTILSGSREAIVSAMDLLGAAGIRARLLPVACAFHSPIVAPARKRLEAFLSGVELESPRLPVYSNATGGRYPEAPEEIRRILAEHLEKPVLFADEVRAMHEDGARVFVEVGPRNVLTGLTDQILDGSDHVSVATDSSGRSGLTQLLHALGVLAAHGVPVNLERLFAGRRDSTPAVKPPPPRAWLVNGSRVRRASEPPERASMPPVHVSFPDSNGSFPVPPAPLSASPENAGKGTPKIEMPAPGLFPAAADGSRANAMAEFQRVMSRFLETQRSVMAAYLAGASATPLEVAKEGVKAEHIIERVAETPRPVERTGEVAPPDPPQGQGRDEIVAKLLEIVGERTGYPPDLLGLDVDIEAELGIDSIKRVEILGTVRRTLLPASEGREDAMEQLTGVKTLRGIVEWLLAALRTADGEGGTVAPLTDAPRQESVPRREVSIARAVRTLADRPLPARNPSRVSASGGTFLVTGDDRGFASAVVSLVKERGGRAVLFGEAVDFTDPKSVEEEFQLALTREGAIAGIIHLAPWARGLDHASEQERLARDVKGFFYLARAAADALEQQGAAGRSAACVMASPSLPSETEAWPLLSFPGHAAFRGMAKTLALEWPSVRCAALEIPESESEAAVAQILLAELEAEDDATELVFQKGGRLSPRLEAAPAAGTDRGLELGPQSVVVLTGGARGITAEIAVDLAKRYRPTLVLWGRTPEPAAEEPESTRGLASEKEIKKALIDEASSRGEAVSLPSIESRYQHLLREREIRRTLERIRAEGARAHYRAVDVRRTEDVESALAWARSELGRIDVVAHGAGVIEDKLARDKTPESFDRVFDTKAVGGLLLAKRMRDAGAKVLLFFGSAAGTFGNRGQLDYAAANEVLGELAERLQRSGSGRAITIHWGPWDSAGMVSAELRREFEKRGIELIPVERGCAIFDAELRAGTQAQLVVAGGSWGARTARAAEPAPKPSGAFPLVRDAVLSNGGHVVRARRLFDPSKDLYLVDHRIDGVEVLPLAVATELMAEVAQQAWPELRVIGVRELHMLRGVVFDRGPKELAVVARPHVEPAHERMGVDVQVDLRDPEGDGKPYYRATVELAERAEDAPLADPPVGPALPPFEAGIDRAYRSWLFHGPLLQGITRIEGLGARGVEAILEPSSPGRCVRGVNDGAWLIDPVVLDSGLQLFLLWARANLDKTPLPTRFTRLRCCRPIGSGPIRCRLRVLEKSRDPVFYIDVDFIGPDGRLLWALRDMEGACSKALNRLGGSWLDGKSRIEIPTGVSGA